MSDSIYHELRECLDKYSFGFPATESGVEIEILKRLATPEEAAMFMNLSMRPVTPNVLAKKLGKDEAEVSELLDRMAKKGLLTSLRKADVLRYAAAPFVPGVYEYQLATIDRELAELFEKYFNEGFHANATKTGSVMLRPIPVNRSVEVTYNVATYEDSRHILEQQPLIGLAECICRVQQKLVDKGCEKPLEACFLFGSHAQYYIDRGMGREVTVEEALEVLDKAEAAGLVPQPFNAINPGGLCNCCGDCCGILRAVKLHPKPAEIVVSNYRAVVNEDDCTACETCIERCQIDAISVDDAAQIDLDRCIGCGLCVTTCPSEAMKLEPKVEADRQIPFERGSDLFMDFARRRGVV